MFNNIKSSNIKMSYVITELYKPSPSQYVIVIQFFLLDIDKHVNFILLQYNHY